MRYLRKNNIQLKWKIFTIVGFFIFLLFVTKIPYINLLFPLWVIIVLCFILLNMLFNLVFSIKGTILIGLWLSALFLVILNQESFAENITIAVVIIFASTVVLEFLKEREIYDE